MSNLYDYQVEYSEGGEVGRICLTSEDCDELIPIVNEYLNKPEVKWVSLTRSETLLYFNKEPEQQ